MRQGGKPKVGLSDEKVIGKLPTLGDTLGETPPEAVDLQRLLSDVVMLFIAKMGNWSSPDNRPRGRGNYNGIWRWPTRVACVISSTWTTDLD